MALNSCYRRRYGYRRSAIAARPAPERGPNAVMLRKLCVLAVVAALLGVAFVLYAWPHEVWPHIVIVPLILAALVLASPVIYLVAIVGIAPELLLGVLQAGVEKLREWIARRRRRGA